MMEMPTRRELAIAHKASVEAGAKGDVYVADRLDEEAQALREMGSKVLRQRCSEAERDHFIEAATKAGIPLCLNEESEHYGSMCVCYDCRIEYHCVSPGEPESSGCDVCVGPVSICMVLDDLEDQE